MSFLVQTRHKTRGRGRAPKIIGAAASVIARSRQEGIKFRLKWEHHVNLIILLWWVFVFGIVMCALSSVPQTNWFLPGWHQ